MHLRPTLLPVLALPLSLALALHSSPAPAQDSGEVSFSRQVLPMFEARCTECHSGPQPEWGLDLATYEGTMVGSDYGPVVERGDPDDSLMIILIADGDMPEEGDPVTPEELEILKSWIRQGAADN